jgi:rubrerythrin
MIKELSLCAEIEKTVGQIYLALAEQASDENELKRIWEEMAEDEMEHARLLQFAQRFDAEKTFDGFNLDMTQLGQLLVQVRETYDLVMLRVWDDDQAVSMMLKLEEDFQQVHIRLAANLKDASMQKMFEKLGKGDDLHVQKLRACRQKSP